jgi:hypothetical protein
MALTGPFGVRGPNSGDPNNSSKQNQQQAQSFTNALAQLSKAVTGAGGSAGSAGAATPSPYGIRNPPGDIGFGNQALAMSNLSQLAQSGTPTNAIAAMNAVIGPTGTQNFAANAGGIAAKYPNPPVVSAPQPNQAGKPGAPGAKTPANLGTNQAKTKFGQYLSANADFNSMLQNPEQISRAYYNFNKMPTHSGGEAMLNNLAPSLPLFYTLMNGQGTGQNMSNAGMMDFIGKYIDQSNSPGAKSIGPADVAKSLFTKDKNSLVFNQLYGSDLTPTQQVGNFLSALRFGLAPSVSAPMLNSVLARASDLGNDFITWRNTHPDGGYTFGDYLQQQGFGPQVFGG